jgi:hypothetical protein
VAKVAKEMLNVIVSKLVNHDWDQISSGSWHQTFEWMSASDFK